MSLELVRKLPYNHPYRYDGRMFGGPQLWTPSEITLQAWFDAYDESTITESSGSVSQWDNKAGGLDLAQAAGASQPTTGVEKINGLNALNFDGVDDFMQEQITITNPTTLFIVAEVDDDNLNQQFTDGTTGGGMVFRTLGSGIIRVFGGATLQVNYVVQTSTQYLFTIVFNGESSKVIVDGTVEGTGDAGTSGVTGLTVGSNRTGTGIFAGMKLGELIFTDGDASPEFRTKIEGYLAHKWGLDGNLPAAHPYKSSPPEV